ncbi:hypothetical protein M3Y99_01810500 [Aphelenchoides fujianensis]|nr:hypothetical protein M3Y99_01810500 [Aphelenchoides fujianensis]
MEVRPSLVLILTLLAASCGFGGSSGNGFVLGSAASSASHAEIVGGARSVAMNSAELADGLLADEYDAVEEEWEDPAVSQGGGRKHKNTAAKKLTTSSHDVFQQGMFASTGAFGETRDFLHFLRRIKYDHRQCPDEQGPVVIDVSIVVSNIRAVSEVTMDYALEMFYRETWVDERLNYDVADFKNKTELALHESYSNFLWHPDTFMPNAIASKNPQKQSISHRSLLRLQEHGRILYSRRISVVAECPMDLVLFPFDVQTCKLGIESYGYTADQVRYQWSRGSISALQLSKIRLPDFQIKEAYVVSHLEHYATGDYSRLYVCFVFNRASGFCFLQLIIPSTAVVITSWVALWMESETEFQDMISIILAITFLIFSYNEMMPRVSYLKALDVWLAVCFMIVFLSLIKLALVKYMRQKLNSQRYREASMVANLLPIIRANSIAGTAPAMENGSYPPLMDADNPSNASLPTGSREQRSAAAQLLVGPAAARHALPLVFGRVHHAGVDLFAKCTGLTRFLPTCRLTSRHMHRFHWISQMMFFFGFVIFALLYFLLYPNLHYTSADPACDRSKAEFFSPIL